MQALARRFGQECGFVVSPGDADVPHLRFFVPEHEMSMCVHATIAVVSLLVESGRLVGDSSIVRTQIGALQTRWRAGEVSVALHDPKFGESTSASDVAGALGIDVAELDEELGPIRSVSTSRPKLIVPLRHTETLHGLQPDWSALWQLCDSIGATGVYAFSRDTASDALHARQFPVRAGYPEDAATGVAASALAAHLTDLTREPGGSRQYRIHQGEAMGRPSLISASARWDGKRVTDIEVSGTSVLIESEHVPG